MKKEKDNYYVFSILITNLCGVCICKKNPKISAGNQMKYVSFGVPFGKERRKHRLFGLACYLKRNLAIIQR